MGTMYWQKDIKWVLEQIKSEFSLEMIILWSYNEVSLERTIMLGNVEAGLEEGKPNMRCIDSGKETMVFRLQVLRRADKNRTFWRALVHRAAKSEMTSWHLTTFATQFYTCLLQSKWIHWVEAFLASQSETTALEMRKNNVLCPDLLFRY